MTLDELLHELRENILHDRSHRVEGSDDLMWTDATLVRYIDQAQRRLAREALVIRDGVTPEVTRIQLVANQRDYVLRPCVIGVVSAKLASAERNLMRTGHAALGGYQAPAQHHFVPADNLQSLSPGRPVAFTTDESMISEGLGAFDSAVLRVFPTPDAASVEEIHMRVVRLPLEALDPLCRNKVPEVPSEHHLEMLDWAAYLALRIVDADAGMPKRALEFRASFEDTVRRARVLSIRRLFAPTQWAFGRGGFTWDR